MRSSAARSLAVAALSLAVLGGCATGGPPPSPRCVAAFDRVDAVLRQGLASYAAQMKRYAATRDPGASTAGAEERARARAEAWSAQHRPEVLADCRSWPEARLRCVLASESPQGLSSCGLDTFVSSFTDEVVSSYAARPVEAPAR